MIYTNDMIKKKNARNRKIKQIINIIYILLVIMILLIISYICYAKIIKKDNSIGILGIKQYVVMTGSMEPNYNIGDLIIDKHIAKEDIKEGDVITYSLGDGKTTVSHRIIDIVEKKGETYYKTKGDNNNAPDKELVEYSQIQGKAVYKIDKIGLILKGSSASMGIIILILIFIVSYLNAGRKDEKRMIREEARKKFNVPRYKKEVT